jgi:predicted lipid-binding transport protein (Tim44 family)
MFALLKMLFYSFIAVMVGVFIGTVPIGGRTIADRVVSAYESTPAGKTAQVSKAQPSQQRAARQTPKAAARPVAAKAAPAGVAAPAAPAAPVTAGAANSPDRHSDEDRQALEKIIASRSSR